MPIIVTSVIMTSVIILVTMTGENQSMKESDTLDGRLFSSTTCCAESGIESSWKQLACGKQQDVAMQTQQVVTTADKSEQSPDRADKQEQTEPGRTTPTSNDDTRLAGFLQNAIRRLDEEPIASDSINSFINSTRVDNGDQVYSAYQLRGCSLPVARVDWNSSGHVVAVAHGRHDHTGWCRHASQVSIWNLALKINVYRPDRYIAIESCSTALAFHPTRPNLLALGVFNGQVLVLDIATDNDSDPILSRSAIEDLTHREPISAVEWVYDAVSNDYLLASIGADGRILLWTLSNKLCNPISGIRLAPSPIYHGHGVLPNKHSVLGGVAFAFSPNIDGLVVAGTEAGGLVRCQIVTPAQYHGRADIRQGGLIWTAHVAALVRHSGELRRHVERAAILQGLRRVDTRDVWAAHPSPADLYPVTTALVYDAHAGPVRAIAFSRHHRHLFLTCATDGLFRIYHVLRSAPLLSLDVSRLPLTDARWSHCRPAVLLVTDANGVVHFVDLLRSIHSPVLSLPMNKTGNPILSLAFNRNDSSLVATGDLDGNVTIWCMSENFYRLQTNDSAFFEQWGGEGSDSIG